MRKRTQRYSIVVVKGDDEGDGSLLPVRQLPIRGFPVRLHTKH